MKKKNGFTLIELLAIIIILGIIAVITVPIIFNMLDNAKKGTIQDSAYGYKDAINKYYLAKLSENPNYEIETQNGIYTKDQLENMGIMITGKEPESNSWVEINNGEVINGCIQYDEYKVEIVNENVSSPEKKKCRENATPQECFAFETNGEGTVRIKNYLCGANYQYNSTTKKYEYVYVEGAILDVKIPSTVEIDGEELTVTEIKASSFKRKKITSVTIPNTITRIGEYAFQTNLLTRVVIPDSVTTIGNYAFKQNYLTNISLSNSITEIGLSTFNDNNLPDDAAYIYKRNPDGTEDRTTVVSYGGNNPNITIPNNITTISPYAFSETRLKSVVIPNTVTSIGVYAFYNNGIRTINIPTGLTKIENYAFAANQIGWNTTDTLIIPNGVTEIGNYAFQQNNMTDVSIPNSVTKIGNDAFTKSGVLYPVVPSSITTMGCSAFKGASEINVRGYSSKPSGWCDTWNEGEYNTTISVNWNYQG